MFLYSFGGQNMDTKSVDNVKLLKFWATWCAPCHAMTSVVESVLKEDSFSNIELVSINVDDDPDAARKYHIRGIPTLLLVSSDNEIINTLIGSTSAEQLKEFLSTSS